ncbi:sirohydrochlorin chelatase [Lactococcus insecticola]|uniref:Cobalamin biosynthesis protein CbiX n=1 Tax=Pseudolactococcus insecticola TaxID=2709158 RepID=A0A6A0B5W6_9LACT|nr:CbiX/SirB N-terminal domain-containing protein [Lactococcus insecticola]GFH39931.1 hypothetical protein Hs20B_03290 [Lactococcus insecticola]
MKAVIYVVHGSQIAKKNQELEQLLAVTTQGLGDFADLYEIAYLERQSDTIGRVVSRVLAHGAREILIAPVLLFPALHALVDIPKQVDEVVAAEEAISDVDIKVTYLKTFGDELFIRDILVDRVRETQAILPGAQAILLAHGTRHFAEPAQMLANIAAELQKKTGVTVIAVDYLGEKTYQEIIATNVVSNIKQVVIPFFIYDGVLVSKINNKVQTLRQDEPIIFTKTLALDPRISQALAGIIKGEKTFDTTFSRLT